MEYTLDELKALREYQIARADWFACPCNKAREKLKDEHMKCEAMGIDITHFCSLQFMCVEVLDKRIAEAGG